MHGPVGLAVVGGRRGAALAAAVDALDDAGATVVAVCDLSDAVLGAWRTARPGIAATARYADVLDDPRVDAVVLATPMHLHAGQAVRALDAGKHVLSEVVAATRLDDCWALVEAVERSGGTYMLAENYCYGRTAMTVEHLCARGLFGEPTFAAGSYLHDCRGLMFGPGGGRTWRSTDEGMVICRGNGYPTHALGPVARWLDVGRSDRLVRTATFALRGAALHDYASALLGAGHPEARPAAWQDSADGAVTLLETAGGRVIVLRVDVASPRPRTTTHYELQGTRGAFAAPSHGLGDPVVWLEGVSPGSALPGAGTPPAWQPLAALTEHVHPRWRGRPPAGEPAERNVADRLMVADFLHAVRTGAPPPIDVYDAVTWSCITPLSVRSVAAGGAPVVVPDFRRGGVGRG